MKTIIAIVATMFAVTAFAADAPKADAKKVEAPAKEVKKAVSTKKIMVSLDQMS